MRERFPSRAVARQRTGAQSAVDLGSHVRPSRIRIVIIEDEQCIGAMIELLVQRQFNNVAILRFENRDAAWQELQQADPDLLITDMNSNNVPGKCDYSGMSGWTMLPLLAERAIRYPILVASGSFQIPGVESCARECAGPKLNVAFLTKPFTADFFRQMLAGLLSPSGKTGRRF